MTPIVWGLLVLQLLLHVAATEPTGLAPIVRMESMQPPFEVKPLQGGTRRRGNRGATKASLKGPPPSGSSVEAQVASILSDLPIIWASSWRPVVLGATPKSKAERESVFHEVVSAVEVHCRQQLENTGLMNHAAAQNAIEAAVRSMRDAVLILLSLRAGSGIPSLTQKAIPTPCPSMYDDPVSPVSALDDEQMLQQVQRREGLLLPPLDAVAGSLAESANAFTREAILQKQQQQESWASATWRNAVEKLERLIPLSKTSSAGPDMRQ
ncbi:hypothetical protein cyc_04096 [Cyclospora cayetanensis]|uniref:Transmembrane protein n=1 Tax=Cyclospora cayetanensis TaxID=88456 RepID=A0A1D3D6G8_9EIME|nr:hypothetical protein cyc_04096 [Cyclospora cayetanensis]